MSCLLTLLVSIGSVLSSNTANDSLCSLPNLPFTSEADVFAFQLNHTRCWRQYMKCGNKGKYNGAQGFIKVFGDDGYFLNASSISVRDGREMKGHGAVSYKTKFAKNMMCIDEEFDPSTFSINITEWGPYNHSFWGETTYVFSMPGFANSSITVKAFLKTIYFEDGIIKYTETQTNSGKFGEVLSHVVDAAQSISELLDLEDEMVDNNRLFLYQLFGENPNPITIIIYMVISVFTSCIASSLCILLFFFNKKRTKTYEAVNTTDMSDISTDDDVNIENSKKMKL